MCWKHIVYEICATILGVLNAYATIMDAGGGPGLMIPPPPHILHQQMMHQAHMNAKHFSKGFIPPFSGSNFLTLPQVPFVGFPQNSSFVGPKLVPLNPPGLPPPPGVVGKHANVGAIGIPPGSPVAFLKSQKWMKQAAAASAGVIKFIPGPVLSPGPSGPAVDSVHHLSINHLFVPVPVGLGQAPGPLPKGEWARAKFFL